MTQEVERKADHIEAKSAGSLSFPAAQIAESLVARCEAARNLKSKGKIDVLEGAHHDALALARLLEALVFIGRLESGLEVIKPRSLQIDPLVRDLVAEFQPSARARGMDLTSRPLPPAVVLADKAGLRLLMISMVDAALLGSRIGAQLTVGISPGDEHVRVEVEREPESSGSLAPDSHGERLMDPALRPEAVQPFLETLEPILTAQGGAWEVAWKPAGSLSIVLDLPAVPPTQGLKEEHVLIIDDDPDGAFLLEQVLLKADYKVQIASNGLEGLALARSGGVSLILLDVMLPGMDGYEVCHRLKDDPATSQVPIVMISAKSRPEDRAMGLRVGASEYMTKPLGLNDVIKTVNALAKPIEGETDNG